VFVVVVAFEVRHALLGLEFSVALPVLVAGVGTSLATGDEVGHSREHWFFLKNVLVSSFVFFEFCALPILLFSRPVQNSKQNRIRSGIP
jgi:hypothetical protein